MELGSIANVSATADKSLSARISTILITIPAANSLDLVAIRVFLKGLDPLDFADRFQYLEAPVPVVVSTLPTSASIASGSRTRLSIKNFPKVSGINDIHVLFLFGTKNVTCEVSWVSSHGQGAIHDLDIDLTSPTGLDVKEGSAAIQSCIRFLVMFLL